MSAERAFFLGRLIGLKLREAGVEVLGVEVRPPGQIEFNSEELTILTFVAKTKTSTTILSSSASFEFEHGVWTSAIAEVQKGDEQAQYHRHFEILAEEVVSVVTQSAGDDPGAPAGGTAPLGAP